MSVAVAAKERRGTRSVPQRFTTVVRSKALVPVAILVLFVLTALLAPWLAPYAPTEIDLGNPLRPPVWQQGGSTANILGTDKLGRDLLSRIVHGARVSLMVIVVSIPVAGGIGVSLGMVAGFKGGWVDALFMRLVDIKLAIPTILLALLFAVVWGPSFINILALLVLTLWAEYARMAHAQTLSLKERDYVLAARTIGASDLRILLVHILPHLANTIIIVATLQIATVVLMEASLSFLGVGIPPPTPAWGLLIADGRELLLTAWWVSTIPGIVLSLVILSANLSGDWLRDYLDPTLRHIA